jgi:hypothetical protein
MTNDSLPVLQEHLKTYRGNLAHLSSGSLTALVTIGTRGWRKDRTMIPAPRTRAALGMRLLLLALLAALSGGLASASDQDRKPAAPAPLLAPAPPEPKGTPGGVAEGAQAPEPLGLIQSAVSQSPARACAAPQQNEIQITTTEFTSLGSCALTVPVSTTVYLSANASVTLGAGAAPFEGQFTLTIDGNTLFTGRRWVNVYTDSGDGTDETVAVSRLVVVGPGAHTFGFQGKRMGSSDGNIKVYSPAVSAIAIPPGGDLKTCASNQGNWSSTSTSYTEIGSCTITAAITGTVYLDANASVGLPSGGANYEGAFRFGLDSSELALPTRWINITTDSGDGSDRSLALSRLATVGPGTHTFKLLGRRYSAAIAATQVYEPQLSAIFIPSGSPVARGCAGPIQDFSNNSTSFEDASSCSLTLPITSTVFLNATASVGMPASGAANYEASFRLGLDSTELAPPTRFLNIYTDSGDGTDKSAAISHLVTVGPGTHTFKLLARRFGAGGPLQVFLGGISALVLNDLPSVSALADQTTYHDIPAGPLQLTVGSSTVSPGLLTLSAASSDQAVVPDANITFGGSGPSRTVLVRPGGRPGSATITVTVSDGANSSTSSFVLTVVASPVYVPIALRS